MKKITIFLKGSNHTPHELHSLHVDLSVIIIRHEKNPPMIILHGETKPKKIDW
jgi:hypothetical protein